MKRRSARPLPPQWRVIDISIIFRNERGRRHAEQCSRAIGVRDTLMKIEDVTLNSNNVIILRLPADLHDR